MEKRKWEKKKIWEKVYLGPNPALAPTSHSALRPGGPCTAAQLYRSVMTTGPHESLLGGTHCLDPLAARLCSFSHRHMGPPYLGRRQPNVCWAKITL